MRERMTIQKLHQMKKANEKIVCFTAYSYEMARMICAAHPEAILVGDSGAKYMLGHQDFNSVTLDEMILLTSAVMRAVRSTPKENQPFVVGDMPFMTYQVSETEAVKNAGRMIQQSGADAVKLEGGSDYAPTVRAIVRAGIPVLGHIGLTPQTSIGAGGYLAKDVQVEYDKVRHDAAAFQEAGAFGLVLTRVPPDLADIITKEVDIPTLSGAGAGDACDGQVCVCHSVFGMTYEDIHKAKHDYGPLAFQLFQTAQRFVADVKAGKPVRSIREGDR